MLGYQLLLFTFSACVFRRVTFEGLVFYVWAQKLFSVHQHVFLKKKTNNVDKHPRVLKLKFSNRSALSGESSSD